MAIKFETIKRQYGEYFLGGGLFLGALILFLAIGLTSFSKYQSDSVKTKEIEGQLEGLKARLAIVNKTSPDRASLAENSKLMDAVLPSDSSVPVVMTEVQQIANETGVTLTALQFAEGGSTVGGTKLAGAVNMQTSAAGSYNTIQAFLKGLENAGRLLIVDSLRFSSTSSQPVAAIGETTPSSVGTTTITVSLNLVSPTFAGKPGTLSQAVSFNTPEFTKLINLVKTFKIYSPTVDASGVGKSNPFTQ